MNIEPSTQVLMSYIPVLALPGVVKLVAVDPEAMELPLLGIPDPLDSLHIIVPLR
jgi:hypothetical protein